MEAALKDRLISYLQDDLAIPAAAIAIALKRHDAIPCLIPVILWQYGLITLDQLAQIFDWLENA